MSDRQKRKRVDVTSEDSFQASDSPEHAEYRPFGVTSADPPKPPDNLNGEVIAILATDGFEQSELLEPKMKLEEAGAKVEVVSPKSGHITGWKVENWGQQIAVDVDLDAAQAEHYDGLVLPGGLINSDQLRADPQAVSFVRSFFAAGKPVAAICHAPWMMIEAEIVDGRKMTSRPSLKTDIRNAGGDWVNRPVVSDRGLITSRNTTDLPGFTQAMVAEFSRQRRSRVKIGPTDI